MNRIIYVLSTYFYENRKVSVFSNVELCLFGSLAFGGMYLSFGPDQESAVTGSSEPGKKLNLNFSHLLLERRTQTNHSVRFVAAGAQ